MSEQFKRNIENFVCEHCGAHVIGNGYTNHCPKCLWSKHVDVHPGDRAAICGGLMAPKELEAKSGEFEVLHHCVTCGHQKRNKTAPDDNVEGCLRGML